MIPKSSQMAVCAVYIDKIVKMYILVGRSKNVFDPSQQRTTIFTEVSS